VEGRNRTNFNRIIDESMITQMSGGNELNKLRNNLANGASQGYDSR